MAVTVEDVITDAVVELGARILGDTPSAEEADLGLKKLQDMYIEAANGAVFGGRLTEVIATENYTAKENQRIVSGGFTITLPTTITDQFTGLARPPADLCQVQVVNTSTDPQISIWDATLNAWVRLDSLTLASDCPLGARYRHGIACALAGRMASGLQRPASDATRGYAGDLRSIISHRASAPRIDTQAEFF